MTFLNISNSHNSITERKHATRSFRRIDSGLRDKVLKAAVTEFGNHSKYARQLKINELRARKSVPVLKKPKETLPTEDTLPTDPSARGLVKSLIKALREWKLERASIIYKLMNPEDRQQIIDYIYQRNQLLPFTRSIKDRDEAQELIHFYFNFSRDDYQWAEGIHFFKEFLLPAAQEHLIKNYEYEKHAALVKVAEEARAFVRNENLWSSNFPNRDNKLMDHMDYEDENVFIEFSEKCEKIRQDLTSLRVVTDMFDIEQPKNNRFLQTLSSAHASKSFSRGNCSETSRLAFDFLKGKVKKVDIYYIHNGDHEFVVINRRKNSQNSRDWSDMGPHCIVLETWGDKKNIFSAHDIPIYLEDYKRLDFRTGKPITERFNPQTQDLRLHISNLYSANDFHSLVDYRYDTDVLKWFECQLVAFQNIQDPARRLMIAHEIIDYRYETDGVLNPENQTVVKNLVSQMKTFLDPEYGTIYDLTPQSSKKLLDPSNMDLEDRIDVDALDHHLSDVMLEHMMKIADVFKREETELGLKKFQKLTDRVKNEVYSFVNFIAKTNGLTWIKEDFGYLAFNQIGNCNIGDDMRAKAINMWIADKLALALVNDKKDEMNKMIERLPPSDALLIFKSYVEKSMSEQDLNH